MILVQGVLLTHESVLNAGAAVLHAIENYDIKLDQDDVMLSYLPLAHIFDRFASLTTQWQLPRNRLHRLSAEPFGCWVAHGHTCSTEIW